MNREEAEKRRDELAAEQPGTTWLATEGADGDWTVAEVGIPGRDPGPTVESRNVSVPGEDPRTKIEQDLPDYNYEDRGWITVVQRLVYWLRGGRGRG
jgi:hypothetical protein